MLELVFKRRKGRARGPCPWLSSEAVLVMSATKPLPSSHGDRVHRHLPRDRAIHRDAPEGIPRGQKRKQRAARG